MRHKEHFRRGTAAFMINQGQRGSNGCPLGVTVGEITHQIVTVKGADIHGSGTGQVEPRGPGGALSVDGADAEGRRVRVTVECSTFTEPVAEGGRSRHGSTGAALILKRFPRRA